MRNVAEWVKISRTSAFHPELKPIPRGWRGTSVRIRSGMKRRGYGHVDGFDRLINKNSNTEVRFAEWNRSDENEVVHIMTKVR